MPPLATQLTDWIAPQDFCKAAHRNTAQPLSRFQLCREREVVLSHQLGKSS